MTCPKQHKKLSSPLHLNGSMKAPSAAALRQDTRNSRNAAKEIASTVGVHENTGKNYLNANTEMSLTHGIKLGRKFKHMRWLILEALLSDGSDDSLHEELAYLKARLQRIEARYNEEFHAPTDLKVNAVDASEGRQMAPQEGRVLGSRQG